MIGHKYSDMRAKTSKAGIIASSIDHLWINGYNNTSIKDVVANAGILKGSFYNYFESKDQFVEAVLEAYTEEWVRIVSSDLLDKSRSPKERIKSLLDGYKDMFQQGESIKGCLAGNMAQEMGGIHEKLSRQVETSFTRIEALYKKCLDDALKTNQINAGVDTEKLAAFLLNGLQGALLRMKSANSVEPIENFELVVFSLLFKP
jgi:TetR/AcrR family transcriptional regulator, transcriptional repressor for nem operon